MFRSFFSRLCIITLSIILALSSFGVQPARAAGITYYVKQGAAGTTCADWANACPDLQTAIALAGSDDQIWVAAGTYKPTAIIDRSAAFWLKSGVAMYGGFAGGETQLSQRDPAAHLTVLSGDLDSSGGISANDSLHVVRSNYASSSTLLDGFTVTGGNANQSHPDWYGGGVYINGGSPRLSNLIIQGNNTNYSGNGYGGGLYAGSATLRLENVTVRNNYAPQGGGIYSAISNLTLVNSSIRNNTGIWGGGLYAFSSTANGSSTLLINVVFSGNNASGAYNGGGGGFYNSRSNATLVNCLFTGNQGGPWHDGGGGAIFHYEGTTTVINSSFSGNQAPDAGKGEALFSWNPGMTVRNSVLWGLVDPTEKQSAFYSGGPTFSFSDIQNAYDVGGVWDTTLGIDGGGDLDADPLFVDANGPDNTFGTVDDDLRLQLASPAINAANLAYLPADTADLDGDGDASEVIPYDLDKSPRIIRSVPDIGAYEYGDIWYVDRDSFGTGCTSWTDACPDLQTALALADPSDDVWVAEGTYYPSASGDIHAGFLLEDNVQIYGGFAGNETSLSQRDWHAHPTILSGDVDHDGLLTSSNSCNVIGAGGIGSGARLDGFTVTMGYSVGWGAPGCGPMGGGMVLLAASPTVANVRFTRNLATIGGGVVVNIYSGNPSNPTFNNVTFDNNRADQMGGGVAVSGSSPTFINTTMYGNSAGTGGGGLAIGADSDPVITNSIAWGNTVDASGTGPQIYITDPGTSVPQITYSDIGGGYAGIGNLDADPQFADPDGADNLPGTVDDDFRLRATSPVIDAGSNAVLPVDLLDLDGDGDVVETFPYDLNHTARRVDHPRTDSGSGTAPLVDMGAYEAYNTAPTLDPAGSPVLTTILEDPAANPGNTISAIIASASGDRIADPDPGALEGIAIIAAVQGMGVGAWQYRLVAGDPWTDISAPSGSAARLLPATAYLRFQPAANYNGSPTITFRAWDQASGSPGGTADTTNNGGTTAFSAASDTATIVVTPVNDEPSFTGGGNVTVNEDSGAYSAGWATNIVVGPADENTQTRSFHLTNDNPGLFAVAPAITTDGILSFTPVANASGTANLIVYLQDSGGTANGGDDTSPTISFSITFLPVNDEPSFTGGGNVTVNEDSGTYSAGWATNIVVGPADESTQTRSFHLTNDNLSLFAVAPVVASDGILSFTPVANASGTANLTVYLQDSGGTTYGGDDTSPTVSFSITISPVNDEPSFTGAGNVTMLEDQSYNAGWATNIVVGPADEGAQTRTFHLSNDNPDLFASSPTIASNGYMQFTPTANAIGTANLTVYLQDSGGTANGGDDTSPTISFSITFLPINDEPSFTSGGNVTVNEDSGDYSAGWATNIVVGPSDESTQTRSFHLTNDNPGLFAVAPSIASDGILSFTPVANASGAANLTVYLQDSGGTANGGDDTGPTVSFSITINPVNDEPSFAGGGNVTVDEDSGAYSAGWATNIVVGPSNESGQTRTFNITANDNPGLFAAVPSIASDGILSFTPTANANGAAHLDVTLQDSGGTAYGGDDTSPTISFIITVNPIDDAPILSAIPDQTINEDRSTPALAFTLSDIDSPLDGLTLQASSSNPALAGDAEILLGGSGADRTVTITPINQENGWTDITIAILGSGFTPDPSAAFRLTVNPVNDQPSFSIVKNLTVLEDSGAYSGLHASSIVLGPANESGQSGTFILTNDAPGLFTVAPALAPDGTLTFTPAPDANGTANLIAYLQDDGGTANGGVDASPTSTFSLHITPINDEPGFTPGLDVTVAEDSGAYSLGWATSIVLGPANESGQGAAFLLTNDTPSLFGAGPSLTSDGTLSFAPAADVNSTAHLQVTLQDDGGTADGGDDTSLTYPLTITITAVNDQPAFTPGADVTVAEDSGAYSAVWATNIILGPADESGQNGTFYLTNDNPGLFTVAPALALDGTLTFTPALDTNGTAQLSVYLQDNGGTADGGNDASPTYTFTIAVTAGDDTPGIAPIPDQVILEDEATNTLAFTVSDLDTPLGVLTLSAASNNQALVPDTNLILGGSGADRTIIAIPLGNQNGFVEITVFVSDGASSRSTTFTVTVTPVNDEPVFIPGPDVIVAEDSPAYSAAWGTDIVLGPADESGQSGTFHLTVDNAALFSTSPEIASDGTLSFTPAPDANGTAQVDVSLQDDGGTADGGDDTSPTSSFTIYITPGGDAPILSAIVDQTVEEDTATPALPFTLADTDTPLDDLTLSAASGNPALVPLANIILGGSGADRTVTITPAADLSGTAAITLTISDGASTNQSTFWLTVTPVNDAPFFTPGVDLIVLNTSAYAGGWATGIGAGPADESSQVLAFTLTNDNPALFSAGPAIAPDGTLSFTPASGATGVAHIEVTLQDDGGTQFGGSDTSPASTFTITLADPTVYVLPPGGNPGPQWSTPITTTSPCGTTFLGEFNNQTVTLTLDDLPLHNNAVVSFDLYIIRSWDGNLATPPSSLGDRLQQIFGKNPPSPDGTIGPDQWSLAAGVTRLIQTTFSNWDSLGFAQAFPGWLGSDYPARTGAYDLDQLCYTFNDFPMDSRYPMSYSFAHSGPSLTLDFSASGLQPIEDESWGLANVRVTLSQSLWQLFMPVVQR